MKLVKQADLGQEEFIFDINRDSEKMRRELDDFINKAQKQSPNEI